MMRFAPVGLAEFSFFARAAHSALTLELVAGASIGCHPIQKR
jgi:hypothetical protein